MTEPAITSTLRVKHYGLQDYVPVWEAMQQLTERRDAQSSDELWVVQHPPVFTLGRIGKPEHLLNPGDIPVVRCDRGGQVTYHGPGQLVVYVLLDIKRKQLGIRHVVSAMEQAVIEMLGEHSLTAVARKDAPGVYLAGEKIASLGLRVKNGCTYHGLSLNVDMDLTPFSRINPCGYKGLRVTQLRDHAPAITLQQAEAGLLVKLAAQLGYNQLTNTYEDTGTVRPTNFTTLTTETYP